MNLWAKRIGQLSLLAVALLSFSCQDETSVLGYRNPNSRFNVTYVEIPIESSVLLRDSLRTSNFSYYKEVNRLLVGNYADDVFGNISASAVTQFFTTTSAKVGSTAVFDSVTLQLQFDLYNYGAAAATPQTISIYELDKELKFDSIQNYFSKTSVPYSLMLGTKTFSINPSDFNKFAASAADKDTVITIKLPLENSFGQRLFNSAYQYATVATDTTYITYSKFVKEFKGIVIRPESNDKIVGFNPLAAASRITLHYHETDKDSLSINLGFGTAVGFNQIKSDRSGTDLNGLNQYYQESLQSSDNRYIQSGVGILTKLDFSKFYEFADTVPNIVINSAEIVIEGVQASSYAPPAILSLRVLNDNNRMRKFSTTRPQDAADFVAHNGYLRYDFAVSQSTAAIAENDSVFYAQGDRNAYLPYSSSTNSYRSVMSLFFQQLTLKNDKKTRFKSFVLYPAAQDPSVPAAQNASKAVNRAIFPKDKIKLKIFYTKPTTPN
jgi:Domain of unknown function (DUF4270)